jgi:NADPH-dependent curcumin reductase CurA
MLKTTSREIRLASRPQELPTADNFSLTRIEVPAPQDGQVKPKETVVRGIDQAVDAFLGLFRGRNVGKMIVELA